MVTEMNTGQSTWIAHESIDYVHGHRHTLPIKLAQVNYAVAPINDLTSVVVHDPMADGGSTCIGGFVAAVIIVEIITAQMGNFLLHHCVESSNCLMHNIGNLVSCCNGLAQTGQWARWKSAPLLCWLVEVLLVDREMIFVELFDQIIAIL